MKRYFLRNALVVTAFFAMVLPCSAQWTDVRDHVRQNPVLACGPDVVYPFDVPAPTPAPAGYEAVYISHYGRHGSRYAYTSKTYSVVNDALTKAAEEDNLTPYGEQVRSVFMPFYAEAQYRVGDLTRKGWEQQRGIARVMLHSFPTAFPERAHVEACVSASFRSALSMTAFCLELGQLRPDLDIYEHQSVMDIRATRPNMSNPFAPESVAPACPTQETPDDFMLRTVDWRGILKRLFKDPDKALGRFSPWQMMDYLYMLVAGMQSLDEDVAMDLSGIFPEEQFVKMWEADNYLRYREYYEYLASCCQVFDDMFDKADAHLAAGERGADLRFGHDHVFQTLMMIARIDEYGIFPDRPEDIATCFQTFRSPMSANLQLVFFRPSSRTDLRPTLVQVLVNGEEIRSIGDGELPPGPFYEWTALKSYLVSRFSLFRK